MNEPAATSLDELLIGESAAIAAVKRAVLRYAPSRLSVLVQGPTGSGKEIVATALHAFGKRTGALVSLNVCALGDGLFEDALFGHVRGAFTGAFLDAPGYLAEGNGGTVFLDEISGLSMPAQAKLLRALETGVYRAIGASRDRMSDFRLVTASNVNLASMVAACAFREDLLHRIGGCVITLPALRDRAEDIPLLVRHFLARAGASHRSLSRRAEVRLKQHEWRGNVRELRNAVERMLIGAAGPIIGPDDVMEALGAYENDEASPEMDLTTQRIRDALRQHGGDAAAAAESLGVHRATFYRWMHKAGIRAATYAILRGSGTAQSVPALRIS